MSGLNREGYFGASSPVQKYRRGIWVHYSEYGHQLEPRVSCLTASVVLELRCIDHAYKLRSRNTNQKQASSASYHRKDADRHRTTDPASPGTIASPPRSTGFVSRTTE